MPQPDLPSILLATTQQGISGLYSLSSLYQLAKFLYVIFLWTSKTWEEKQWNNFQLNKWKRVSRQCEPSSGSNDPAVSQEKLLEMKKIYILMKSIHLTMCFFTLIWKCSLKISDYKSDHFSLPWSFFTTPSVCITFKKMFLESMQCSHIYLRHFAAVVQNEFEGGIWLQSNEDKTRKVEMDKFKVTLTSWLMLTELCAHANLLNSH